jgi:hypothetical protein
MKPVGLARPGLVFLSPLLVLAVGRCAAIWVQPRLKPHLAALIPMLVCWATLTILIVALRGLGAYREWLRPSQGRLIWRLLSLVTVGLTILPVALMGKQEALDCGASANRGRCLRFSVPAGR